LQVGYGGLIPTTTRSIVVKLGFEKGSQYHHLILLTKSEIIDYTSHQYLLFKDNKDVLTNDPYAELFHVTNLSFYKEIIKLE